MTQRSNQFILSGPLVVGEKEVEKEDDNEEGRRGRAVCQDGGIGQDGKLAYWPTR